MAYQGDGDSTLANLNVSHKRAWVAFFVSSARLRREIDRDLAAAGVASLDVYDILLALEDAPAQRMRMRDLAERVLFSPSGLTRMVDRLEQQGWLCRAACPNDRRALYAVLTEAGGEARKAAWPIYRSAIQRLFAEKMTREEAELMTQVLSRMLGESETCLLNQVK